MRLFVAHSKTERSPLFTVEIDNIPSEPARPRIDLRCTYRHSNLLVEISLNGSLWQTAKVRIPQNGRYRVAVISAVAGLAAVAIGFAIVTMRPAAAQPSAAAAQIAIERSWEIHFLPDETSLTATARTVLAEIAGEVRGNIITAVTIVGHCAIAGTEAGRTEISDGCASNVYDFLSQRGLQYPKETVVKGVGSADPLTLDPARQELNRRVEVKVAYRQR